MEDDCLDFSKCGSIQVKVIFAVVKQLKQLQRKARNKSEARTGFEPMTSAILVQCSTKFLFLTKMHSKIQQVRKVHGCLSVGRYN